MLNQVEIEVSENDIDDLGHVNNARFLEYFERGRLRWYNSIGLLTGSSSGARLGTVVVSMKINFRRECFQGDLLSVHTAPGSRGNRSYVLSQEIRNDSGELVSDAEVTSVVMNLEQRAVIDIPIGLARQFEKPASTEDSTASKENS
ncbi:MAG: acyl-CoA thioesterase [Gammaproteobacteria bacterium]|nr:acyl-CoA thioesterase [Gammaproteobacteria bacterium]MDH3413484.1 acyl-CoA thioesterase [Gammaproteobacteria bacterium]